MECDAMIYVRGGHLWPEICESVLDATTECAPGDVAAVGISVDLDGDGNAYAEISVYIAPVADPESLEYWTVRDFAKNLGGVDTEVYGNEILARPRSTR
jgi:hypothetical protein